MNISLATIKQSLARFIGRYHIIIFCIFVVGGLAVIVFMLNTVIGRSGDMTAYETTAKTITFDTETIKRLDELKTTNQASTIELPTEKRANPFVE